MFKKVALPINTMLPGGIALPPSDDINHPVLTPETDEHVQMVWHEQQQRRATLARFMVNARSSQQRFAYTRVAKLIGAPLLAADGNKIAAGGGIDPRRRIMSEPDATGIVVHGEIGARAAQQI
jgi:hypothetical protein